MSSWWCYQPNFWDVKSTAEQLTLALAALQADVSAVLKSGGITAANVDAVEKWWNSTYAPLEHDVISITDAVKNTIAWSPNFCDLEPRFESALEAVSAAGKEWTKATGRPDPTAAYKRTVDEKNKCDWLCKVVWTAVIIGGAYLGYRMFFGNRPLLGGHDDGEISQHELPHYAGGSRR